jgi:hypothetical protein
MDSLEGVFYEKYLHERRWWFPCDPNRDDNIHRGTEQYGPRGTEERKWPRAALRREL